MKYRSVPTKQRKLSFEVSLAWAFITSKDLAGNPNLEMWGGADEGEASFERGSAQAFIEDLEGSQNLEMWGVRQARKIIVREKISIGFH